MAIERRTAVVAIALLLIVSILAAPVAAQVTTEKSDDGNTTATPTTPADTPTQTQLPTETPTTTPTATPTAEPTTTAPPTAQGPSVDEQIGRIRSGEYSLDELSEAGESPPDDPRDSMRYLGSPVEGFALINYQDPTIMDMIFGNNPAWKDVSSDTRVEQNRVRFQAAAWGGMSGEYTLHTVYYQEKNVEINNQTYTYAANQSEETTGLNLGDTEDSLYTTQNISLDAHYDEPYKVTMWLSQGGEPVDGARWTFEHLSNPAAKSVNVTSSGGLWAFSLRNAIVPGAIAVVVGLAGAWLTIKQVGRGPGYGVGSWALLTVIVGTVVSLVATYQIAVVLQNAPWVMGGSLFIVSYAAGLTFHDPVKKIGFMRRELLDADTMGGDKLQKAISDGGEALDEMFGGDGGAEVFDELTEAVFVDLPQVPAVRTDNGYKVPVTGLKPFFARFFASAAVLDLSGIATRTKVRVGELDDIITVDPASDPALEHKAATMVRVLPTDTLREDAPWQEKTLAYILTAAIVLVPAIGGGMLFARYWNIPSVGIFLGLIATAIMAYSAEDGWIDFKEAPHHYKKAEDSLTMLQRAYKAAKEEETGQQAAREERARTALEARDDAQKEKKTVTDKILDSMGVDEIAMEKSEFDFDHSGEIDDGEVDDVDSA